MALQDGDVVRFDYTLWVDGKVVDTSREETAKKEGTFRDSRKYRPLTIILGSRQIIPGLESHIRSHGQTGKSVEVDIAPEDAYGAREAAKVRDIPMAQFRSQKVQPQVGLELNLGGERGVVTRVAGGRVRVDLNHELAGKTLRYEYTVQEVLQDQQAKVNAVLEGMFPAGGYKVDLQKDAVTIEVPDQVKFDQNWMMAKFSVVAQVRLASGKDKAVKLVETFPVMPDPPAEGAAPGRKTSSKPGHEGHDHA